MHKKKIMIKNEMKDEIKDRIIRTSIGDFVSLVENHADILDLDKVLFYLGVYENNLCDKVIELFDIGKNGENTNTMNIEEVVKINKKIEVTRAKIQRMKDFTYDFFEFVE